MPDLETDFHDQGSMDLAQALLTRGQPRVGTEISLRKLQIFWAVSHTGSLTRAAKVLSLAQPTVSQQLAALEAAVGNRLFERSHNGLSLTEFGISFTRHAENVLRVAQELEDMVAEYGRGKLHTVSVAGVPSALRALMPRAMMDLQAQGQLVDFDMHEGGPSEVLEMLYARRINMALLALNTVGDLSPGFAKVPLRPDPYVLVVPEGLDLDHVTNPEQELTPAQQEVMRRTIQFAFGNQHSKRLQNWFDQVAPGNRTVARARSFELVVEMVRGGLGICVAPALSAAPDAVALSGVRVYQLSLPAREIAAIIPAHYQRHEPYLSLLKALQDCAAHLPEPALRPEPPFIALRTKGG